MTIVFPDALGPTKPVQFGVTSSAVYMLRTAEAPDQPVHGILRAAGSNRPMMHIEQESSLCVSFVTATSSQSHYMR